MNDIHALYTLWKEKAVNDPDLVSELAECLKKMGKKIKVSYF